jgi:peptidoglycan/LPS O-acetylase OafA/YrhL
MKPHLPVGHSGEWSVELLRGVAAVLVVLAHYGPSNGLDLGLLAFAHTGVDLFFVLSGFVFAPYFFGRPLDTGGHLVRRFFRLYPLYAVALLVYAWPRCGNDVLPEVLLKHAFFLHTLGSLDVAFYLNPAFWSLPPEVEFYLALPLLGLLIKDFRGVAVAALLSTLLHLGVNFLPAPSTGGFNPLFLQVHLPGLLCEFIFGALAWRLAGSLRSPLGRLLLIASGIALWLGLASVFVSIGDSGIATSRLFKGNMGLFSAAAFALAVCGICGAVRQPPTRLRVFSSWAGNLSSGTYLFHNAAPPLLRRLGYNDTGLLFAFASLVLTLAIASLLNLLWEDPWRRFGRRLAHRGGSDAATEG